ncbi:MAG: metallophosphoesterase [Acidobacteria bacterium]|nr:metallophosphoesterase [Acidobacteriota bacterium]
MKKLILFSFLAIIASVGAWGLWLEPASLKNENYQLLLPDWPQECAGIRIALLSDLHVGSPFNGVEKLERIVAVTNHAQPHLVLIAGDFIINRLPAGTFVPPDQIATRLLKLKPRLGTFAVLGNHDRWHGGEEVLAAFAKKGLRTLEDEAAPVTSGSCHFWVVGVSDYWTASHDFERALRPVSPGEPIVVFTHNPDIFPELPPTITVTLAGHTHGGQISLPFWGPPIVLSKYGKRYARGHIVEEGEHLFVTPGLGSSIIPMRFLVTPEISVLDLLPAQS